MAGQSALDSHGHCHHVNMDIELRTHDPERQLALREVHPEDDHPSYRARIIVRCDGILADRPFWIERHCVATFLDQLHTMDRTLSGRALLQPLYDGDHVQFELSRTGALTVAGELGYASTSHLRFEFTTDQTCIRPLIADVERLLTFRAPAV
jgi:hypothetical protein